jgi:hypothetical protein
MNLSKSDILDEYILELENQIKYRDEIILENQIDITSNPNIKTLEILRNKYSVTNSKTSDFGPKIQLPPVTSYNNDLSFVLNNTNNISNNQTNNQYNNTNNRGGGMLFSGKKNSHLDNLKNKFNTNNNNNLLLDYKTKNNYSSYKILSNDNNKTKTNSPLRKNNSNINQIYNLYKYNSNINKNRISSSNRDNNIYNRNENFNNKIQNNNSFILDYNKNNTIDTGSLLLKGQIPQIKKSDLNNALYQRNINRQFIVNSQNKNKF